ncbi:hypothetical protein V2J52_15605 [Georgenia sp. MJ173]|uniref:hypothetical protein n=1 Tax=Georgenia sunbinii TaxID=3117728 RepID=UPI002F262846
MTDLYALTDAQARELAGHGTPCFGYSLDVARERFTALRAALPERVLLAYAVKANPGAPLLRAFAGLGAWFDCASAGEVEAVAAARRAAAAASTGAGTGGTVLAGPAKSEADLRAGLAVGARVQVDGIEDVARIAALLDADHNSNNNNDDNDDGGAPLAVNVRVHPATGVSETASIIGGAGPSAFGVDEEDLPDFLAAVARYPQVRLAGLQVFSASNELDAAALLANHRTALEIGERLHREHGVELELIDLGGGLGIPYVAGAGELDIAALGAGLSELLAEHPWCTGRLLLEPGRWLAGPTGVYLSRVVRVKESRGATFAVLEGGINHLLRPLLTGQSFPVRVVASDDDAAADTGDDGGVVAATGDDPATSQPAGAGAADADTGPDTAATQPPRLLTAYTLAGPLCTSLDRIGTAELGPLRPGDLLMFGQAGAYGFTQAMTSFLSHPVPAQHWLGE